MVISKKFVFTVSLCAMLAVNPVLATDPSETQDANDTVGTKHNVYVETTLPNVQGYQTYGIAGVTYVNRMVNAAGVAAQAAEGHAAAAGASALSAAESAGKAAASAKAANEALADKVDIEQGDENANKVMVTDSDGTMYPGYLSPEMIQVGELKPQGGTGTGSYFDGTTGVLVSDGTSATAKFGLITSGVIASGAVISSKIADGAVTSTKIAAGAVVSGAIAAGAVVSGAIAAGAVIADKIANGAVTESKIGSAAVTADKIGFTGGLLEGESNERVLLGYMTGDSERKLEWGLIRSRNIGEGAVTENKIAAGAVTIDKTDGVVGMVPVGSADATTYANFWIE